MPANETLSVTFNSFVSFLRLSSQGPSPTTKSFVPSVSSDIYFIISLIFFSFATRPKKRASFSSSLIPYSFLNALLSSMESFCLNFSSAIPLGTTNTGHFELYERRSSLTLSVGAIIASQNL